MRDISPLRYPGGKAKLFDLVSIIIKDNDLLDCRYLEPYAGGAGLALKLLATGVVESVWLNDIDPAIYAFWISVLYKSDEFKEFICTEEISPQRWRYWKSIYTNPADHSSLQLGFAAFFLNRTNRSGIISGGGIIGGKAQLGDYKMDCRFNREALVERIDVISSFKDNIRITNLDAQSCLDEAELCSDRLFVNLDPPYYNKGRDLYTSYYEPQDHKAVRDRLVRTTLLWMLTYDNTCEVRELYHEFNSYTININYSAQMKRVASELLVTSNDLYINMKKHHQVNMKIQSCAPRPINI